MATVCKCATIIIAMAALVRCTYQAAVDISPSLDVYSSYDNRIPGTWALTVDAREFDGQEADVEGLNCSFHKYPVNAGDAFTQSAVGTFRNLVEGVQMLDEPLTAEGLARSDDFTGQIIIDADDLDAEIVMIEGFWKSRMKAEVEMSASVVAISPEGRLFGRSLNAEGEGQADAGVACGGGGKATQEATEQTIEDLLQEIGEAVTNSPRIRQRFPD